MKTFLTIEVCSDDMKLVLAATASAAAVASPFTGIVAVHEVSKAELFDVQSTYVATPIAGPAASPIPKTTAPDRPSNVGQLKQTVELPDLGTIDDEDDLPF